MIRLVLGFILVPMCILGTYAEELQEPPGVNDSVYFFQLRDSVGFYMHRNLPEAENSARKRWLIARGTDNDRWKIEACISLSGVLTQKGSRNDWLEAEKLAKYGLSMAENTGDSTLIYALSNNLTITYIKLDQVLEALKSANRAVTVLKSSGEKEKLAHAHSNRAIVYRRLSMYKKAIEEHEWGYKLCSEDDFVALGSSLYNQGIIYHQHLASPEKALVKYVEAKDFFIKGNYMMKVTAVEEALGTLFIEQGNYELAREHLYKALALTYTYELTDQTAVIYGHLSNMYSANGQIDSALYFIDASIHLADSLGLLMYKTRGLTVKAWMIMHQGDSSTALELLEETYLLTDSLEKLKNIPEATQVILDEQKRHHETQIFNYQRSLSKKELWLWCAAGVIILVAILGFLSMNYFRKRRVKLQHSLYYNKQEKALMNRKMTTIAADLAIKNDLLGELIELLKRLNGRSVNLDEEVQNTQYLLKENMTSEQIWEAFFLNFDRVHPSFIESLRKEYKLSVNDLKFCAFIKMDLSNKEISQLLGVNPMSMHTITHRLKKKLKLNKTETVANFIAKYPFDHTEFH